MARAPQAHGSHQGWPRCVPSLHGAAPSGAGRAARPSHQRGGMAHAKRGQREWRGHGFWRQDRKSSAAVLPGTGHAGPQRGTEMGGAHCPAGTSLSPPHPGPRQLLEPFKGGKLWQNVFWMMWWPAATRGAMGQRGSSGARAAGCSPGCWSSHAGLCERSKSMAQLGPASSWGQTPKHLLLLRDMRELAELSLLWAELMSCPLVRNKFS